MMTIGTMVMLSNDVEKSFEQLKTVGLSHCQLMGNEIMAGPDGYTDELAERILAVCKREGVTITTYWAGWTGPMVWDFIEGPLTLGFVPVEYRHYRIGEMKRASDFAKKLGITQMATHAGFLPENPSDPNYPGVIAALRNILWHVKDNGQKFLFETGQETPVTLRRAIEDLGKEGLGINLDPANLLLYGKANPVDALDVFGEFVCDVHAKDGEYPTNGRQLGEEKPLGQGSVNFPALIAKLKSIGYDGPLTIEREISGEEQDRDILSAIEILKELI